MSKQIFWFVFILQLFSCNYSMANYDALADSLKHELKSTDDKRIKADLLLSLSNHYNKTHTDSALIYANQAFNVSSELRNDTLIMNSLNQLGNIYNNKGLHDVALNFFIKALAHAETINYQNKIARINNNIGIVYYHQQMYDKTLEYFIKSGNILIETGDTLGAIYAFNNIGGVYNSMGDNNMALEYFNQGLELAIAIKHESSEAILLTGIGTVHAAIGETDLALKELIHSLSVKRKGGNMRSILHSLVAIGDLYMKIEKYDSALIYMIEYEELAHESGFLTMEQNGYLKLSNIYEEKGLMGTSLDYLKRHMSLKDSLTKDESEKSIAEIQAKFDKSEDQKKIELLKKNDLIRKKEIERKNVWNMMLIGGGIILLIFAIFIFLRLKNSRLQNEIIRQQKLLVDEKNKEVLDSINYAKRIQHAMLKAEDHESKNLPEHFVLFKPKDIVSGDFYWAFEKDRDFYLAAVDCTGHGVPGAFLTMLGTAFLNEITSRPSMLKPGQILDELRNRIIKELGQKGEENSNRDGMDISMIRVNLDTLEGEWAGANNPLWYIREGEGDLQEIKANKQSIGFASKMNPFTDHKISFNKGDVFYLFSDGYADQFGGFKENLKNGRGKKFKSKRLKDLLISAKGQSMSSQLSLLDSTIETWRGDIEQIDDICVIGMRL